MFSTKLKGVFDRKSIGSVAILASGTAIGQAIAIICAPILTRIYTPTDLGILTVFISIVSILRVIVSLRYEFAIPLPEDERIAASIFAICMVSTIIISILSGFAIWLSGAWLATYIPIETLIPFLWLIPIAVLGTGLYGALSSWTVRTQGYRHLASSMPVQRAGQSLTTIGLGVLGYGPIGLLLGEIVGRCFAVLPLIQYCWSKGLPTSLAGLTISKIRHSAHRYKRFPLLSTWAALLNAAGAWFPMMFMAAFFSLQVAGWLTLAHRIIGIPIMLLSASVAKVYFSDCARAIREGPESVINLFWNTIWRQLAIAISILAIFVMPAPYFFAFLFGDDWTQAGWFLVALSPMFISQFVASPLGATLDVFERQDLHMIREMFRITFFCVALFCIVSLNYQPIAAIVCFSIASLLSNTIGLGLASYAINKYESCEPNVAY